MENLPPYTKISISRPSRPSDKRLEERFEFSAIKAYCHASLCGNLIVSQLINIKKGFHRSVDISTLRHREIRT